MDDIETSVAELQHLLNGKAPNLTPAVFPSGRVLNNIYDFCSSDEQRSEVSQWLSETGLSENSFIFQTELKYSESTLYVKLVKCSDQLEKGLSSLEHLMSLFVNGVDRNELKVLSERFQQINSIPKDGTDGDQEFYEVCNLSYTLKVIVSVFADKYLSTLYSNIPQLKICLGDQSLPFQETQSIKKILASAFASSSSSNGVSDDEYGENEQTDEAAAATKKRRKKSRSKSSKA